MRLDRRTASAFSVALCVVAGSFAACSSEDGQPQPAADDTGTPPTDTAVDTAMAIDTSTPDTATSEVATDAADAPADEGPETSTLPFSEKLSEMSLFSDFAAKTVAPINVEYRPAYELWADNLTKKRWIALPPGTKIDNSKMDHWIFPVGTRLWKEFSKDGKRLETRMIWKTSSPDQWKMGTYLWNADESEANWTAFEAMNLRGTGWDSPSEAMCHRCHEGDTDRVLGFSAIQLAAAPGGVNLAGLEAAGLLTVPLVAGKNYGVPGTDTEKAALGYLHANCGHCHNDVNPLTWPLTKQVLRLYVDQRDVVTTTLFTTTVNVATESYSVLPFRIHGGDALGSAVYERQNKRGAGQMPPIATKVVNTAGILPVKTWIDSLPKGPDAGITDTGTDAGSSDSATDAAADGG